MITCDQLVGIGQINKPHGVKGEMSATLLIGLESLRRLPCVVCDMDGIFVPFFIETLRPRGTASALLTIDGIKDDNEAAAMTGKKLHALRADFDRLADSGQGEAELPPTDYFIGFALMDKGTMVGTVEAVDDTTENVLFTVSRPDGTQVIVPAAADLVIGLNPGDKTIDMDLPEGLLEI